MAIVSDMEFSHMNPEDQSDNEKIVLTVDDRERIQCPWIYSVIIKLTRNKVNYKYLKYRLIVIENPIKELILIDLGHKYFIVKFLTEENMLMALHKGPWFINGIFLSIRKCHPNYVVYKAMENS